MPSLKKLLLASTALSLLSGCVGTITGNKNINAANYAAAGLIDAKATREKQSQENFEQYLDKKTQTRK